MKHLHNVNLKTKDNALQQNTKALSALLQTNFSLNGIKEKDYFTFAF